MLNKAKVLLALGIILQVIRVFFPQLDISNAFEGATVDLIETLYVLVPLVIAWFIKESDATVDALVTK